MTESEGFDSKCSPTRTSTEQEDREGRDARQAKSAGQRGQREGDIGLQTGQAQHGEEEINKLKTLKRAMYGRARVDFLRARMMPICRKISSDLGQDMPKQ